MNILMLGIKEYPYGISAKYEKFPGGGTAKYVISLSEHLCKFGHKVSLVVRKMPGQKSQETIGNLRIYRVGWLNNKYLRWPVFSFLAFAKALSISKKIDLIHTHGSFDAIFGILINFFRKKTKIVGTPHGLTSYQAKDKYNKIAVKLTQKLEKFSFERLPKIVFLTESEKETVQKHLNLKNVNYSVLNMGILPLELHNIEKDCFNVVFIGRLIPIKGLDKFIGSYNYLPDSIKGKVKYIIVGDGFYRVELEKLTKKMNLDNFVSFPGFTENIGNFLALTSLFILPSEGGEGLPVSVLEAMSCEVPCMFSNFNHPFSEKCYIKLPNNNPETIAAKINYYYHNQSELKAIAKEAKVVFDKDYHIKNVAKRFEEIYFSL
jgi:glycosyltransferase involved in cell wall biosynthesis